MQNEITNTNDTRYRVARIGDGSEDWDLPDTLTLADHPSLEAAKDAADRFIFSELPQSDYGHDEGATSVTIRVEIANVDSGEAFSSSDDYQLHPDEAEITRKMLGFECQHDFSDYTSYQLGGTTMRHRVTCPDCGLTRIETNFGAQRNPGDVDSVEFVR